MSQFTNAANGVTPAMSPPGNGNGMPGYVPGNGMLGVAANHDGSRPTVQLTMVSDFNCPWCYVAHKEVQIALTRVRQTHPNTVFSMEYRPFELDPTLPSMKEKPMCRIACYKAKFGEEKMKKVSEVLKERGRRVGIDFHFAGKTRQTTNAHRLSLKAWLCGGEAAQTKMVDALFAAYFEKETDIGCYDYLSKAAESTGLLTAEHARAFLMSDKLLDEVKCLIRHSALREIKGVPFTIVANQWAIQGAETAESFYRAFDFAATAAETLATPIITPGLAHNANNMVTPEGISGTAPKCATSEVGSVNGDHASETATQSGTSGPSTPTNSNFGSAMSVESRMPVAV